MKQMKMTPVKINGSKDPEESSLTLDEDESHGEEKVMPKFEKVVME